MEEADINSPPLCCVFSVHQEDLTETEKVLRQFDLTSKYGPCTDITRLERWERASLLVSDLAFFYFYSWYWVRDSHSISQILGIEASSGDKGHAPEEQCLEHQPV